MNTSWLDRIKPQYRHYLIGLASLVAAAGLSYIAQHINEWTLTPLEAALVAPLVPLIPVAVMGLTKLSKQYGIGSSDTVISSEGNDTVPPAGAVNDHADPAPIEDVPVDATALDPGATT
jgi:hypothetical protein